MAFDATFEWNWLNELAAARQDGPCLGEVSAEFDVNLGTALRMHGVRHSELAEIDMSIRCDQREGAADNVAALISLRNLLLAEMPTSHAQPSYLWQREQRVFSHRHYLGNEWFLWSNKI